MAVAVLDYAIGNLAEPVKRESNPSELDFEQILLSQLLSGNDCPIDVCVPTRLSLIRDIIQKTLLLSPSPKLASKIRPSSPEEKHETILYMS